MRQYKVEKDFIVEGYRCVIVGQSLGHRCGYIGLPKGHPLHGKDYDEIDINVHGGLTYSDNSGTYPVENTGDIWWIGFDCGHYMDGKDFELIKELTDMRTYFQLLQMEKMFRTKGIVRTKEYVENELRSVVNQLIKLTSNI